MSRILVASTPLLGHVSPMLLVAKSLHQRGHEVCFLTASVFREKTAEHGVHFVALRGYADYDYKNIGSLFTPQEAAAIGMDAHVVHLRRIFGDALTDQYRSLQNMIEVFNPDVIVIDILFMGILPLLLLDKQDRPQVISCGVIAPMWRDPGSSPFTGPDNTEAGRLKNIDDGFKFDASVLPGTAYIDRILHSLRVSVQGGFRMFDTMYTLPDQVLQFCTKDFEYPLAKSRENLLFVGPILPGSPADRNESKGIDGVDGSLPSVLVTQGTLANIDFDQLVNPTIKGLAGENLQIIVTAGGGDLSTIVRAPNTVIRRFIPYGSALRSASAFITNGGYNGVQEALSFGVPIVSAGATEDKPYVSARVAWSGAGLNLHTGNPTPNQIRDAVIRVRSEPYFRRHAVRLSDTIRQTDALAAVASIVDAVSPSQYQYH